MWGSIRVTSRDTAAWNACIAASLLTALLLQAVAPAPGSLRSGAIYRGDDEPQSIIIEYAPTGTPRSVCVAGTFNGWSTTATPLTARLGSPGWRTTLSLEPGIYQYRIVVNGSRWITPPDAPRLLDAQGNPNALLVVSPPGYAAQPARTGDGKITAAGVLHRPFGGPLLTLPAGVRYAVRKDRTHLSLTLRTRHDDVQKCRLLVDNFGALTRISETKLGGQSNLRPDSGRRSLDMTRYASDALFDYWRCDAAFPPNLETLRYAFVLTDGSKSHLYDFTHELRPSTALPHFFAIELNEFPPYDAPDWARDAVFYQIFPDRFADGDRSIDPPDVQPWDSKSTYSNWMGGDIAGIIGHFDYLRELGINALYLNPIFAARSNHAYDTTDYTRVDPRFGTTESLKALTAKAHLHGWHVVLDGVFNHTGVDFVGFKSLQTDGERSPYRSWYYVHGFPIQVKEGQKNYDGWFGTPWMPKLNVNNPATRDYLLDIGTRWIRDAKIDGWRLDAANEVSHDFWRTFRKRVRIADPNAFLIGEIWGDARDWLAGDQFDSVMNYRWRGAALDYFALDKASPRQFERALATIRTDYPADSAGVMLNMLDSHDTERIRTSCRGDWGRQRQAVLFQMTYPGIPCIYYGDEIGMEGGRDPDNRRGMVWDQKRWDRTSLAFYKALLEVRRKHSVLRRGDYQTVLADDASGAFAYQRVIANERAIVVFNRSNRPLRVTLPAARIGQAPLTDWLGGGLKMERRNGQWFLNLPPRGIALLGR